MTPTFTIDQRVFARQLDALVKLMNKEPVQVVESAVRIAVDACWRLTPPTASRHPMDESTKASQKQGEYAIENDIGRVFTHPGPGGVEIAERSDIAVSKIFWKLIKAGRMDQARGLLASQGVYVDSVAMNADPAHHWNQRNRRGRVRKKPPRQLVLNPRSVSAYIKHVQKRVGYARSGWKKAVIAVNARGFPAWASRHSGPGIFQRLGTTDAPVIVFGNAVPYIQRAGAELRVMKSAFEITQNKLAAMMKVLMAKANGTFRRTR